MTLHCTYRITSIYVEPLSVGTERINCPAFSITFRNRWHYFIIESTNLEVTRADSWRNQAEWIQKETEQKRLIHVEEASIVISPLERTFASCFCHNTEQPFHWSRGRARDYWSRSRPWSVWLLVNVRRISWSCAPWFFFLFLGPPEHPSLLSTPRFPFPQPVSAFPVYGPRCRLRLTSCTF